jgi:energy-coupling factor transporter ATP-binding protein EcfA2
MRLQQVALQGFQSYTEEQTIEIDEHVTLLAGRNNVGKSALLRALQIPVESQEGAANDFALTYTWLLHADDIRSLFANREDLGNARDWLLDGGEVRTFAVTFTSGNRDPDGLPIARLKLDTKEAAKPGPPHDLAWIDTDAQAEYHQEVLVGLSNLARRVAGQILYLAPRRIDQGLRHFSQSNELQPDARNLTDVVLHLYLNHRYDIFAEVETMMQSAFAGLRGLAVPTAEQPGGGNQLQGEPQVYFEGRTNPIPLQHCGTGLEQMLALAIGVLTAKEPRLVLIDEPQAYLHPHAERSMLRLFDDHPEHQFIVATHSHTLLRAQPLARARLLSLEDGRTRVAHVRDEQQVLGELGVSAADLWLVDRLLWVEGPTEERVFELLAASRMGAAERSTMGIRRMPGTSRFAGSTREAQAAYDFCSEVAKVIAPLAVDMLFVFDADEKSADFRKRIQEASHDRAIFLPVRELENLFLKPVLLQRGLAALCELADLPPPELECVTAKFDELIAEHDDPDLYPGGTSTEEDDLKVVRGSSLLKRLWWDLVRADYDKVRDGELLAKACLETGGEELAPLAEILERIAGQS